jgi:hypothetical protein
MTSDNILILINNEDTNRRFKIEIFCCGAQLMNVRIDSENKLSSY